MFKNYELDTILDYIEDNPNDEDVFEFARALYWFCADYYSGQHDDLYRILSRLSGMLKLSPLDMGISKDTDDGTIANDLYLQLVKSHKT